MPRDPFDELRNAAIAAGYSVRESRPEDADEMHTLWVRIWRATYRGIMPDALLDTLGDSVDLEARRARIAEQAADPRIGALVATDRDGRIVGMGTAGPGRDEKPPVHHELRAINIAPEAQGTGLAHLMMDALVGTRAAYLWVARGNDRAVRFYDKYGFLADGAAKQHPSGAVELRMVRY